MLAGTVYFYDDFKRVIKEMDIEDYDELSQKEFFELIITLGAEKVVVSGESHNHQANEYKAVLYSKRY